MNFALRGPIGWRAATTVLTAFLLRENVTDNGRAILTRLLAGVFFLEVSQFQGLVGSRTGVGSCVGPLFFLTGVPFQYGRLTDLLHFSRSEG